MSQIDDWLIDKKKNGSNKNKDDLKGKYLIKSKRFKVTIEERKNRKSTKTEKLRRF